MGGVERVHRALPAVGSLHVLSDEATGESLLDAQSFIYSYFFYI